jgi:hypothetical protein
MVTSVNAGEVKSPGVDVCERKKEEILPTDATPSMTEGAISIEFAGGAKRRGGARSRQRCQSRKLQ